MPASPIARRAAPIACDAARHAIADRPSIAGLPRARPLSLQRPLRDHRQCLHRCAKGARSPGSIRQGGEHQRCRKANYSSGAMDCSPSIPFPIAWPPETQAKLAEVKTEFENLKSNYASLGKQIELSRQLGCGSSDYDRELALLNNRISTPSDVDRSRAAWSSPRRSSQLQRPRPARASTCSRPELPLERFPQYVEAMATLDRARRDLENTTLRAPIAGVAAQVASIQMGRYLVAGAAVFSIIDSANVWIDANPKETDLTYRPAGAAVAVRAMPSRRGIGPASSPPSPPARVRSFPFFRRRTRPATGLRSCSGCPCGSNSQRGRTCAGCARA